MARSAFVFCSHPKYRSPSVMFFPPERRYPYAKRGRMTSSHILDCLLEWVKKMERMRYHSEYANEQLKLRWESFASIRYQERVFKVRPDTEKIRSLLIFKPDEIGDAICSLPAIRELKRHLPKATLYLICSESTAPIFERTHLIDEISAVRPATYLRRFRSFDVPKALRNFPVREFDAAVFLRTYPAFFRQFLKIRARVRIHPRDPRMRSNSIYRPSVSLWGEHRKHQWLQLLEIVSMLTGRTYDEKDPAFPDFHWTPEDRDVPVTGSYIVLHPYAKNETRRYPEQYWSRILSVLKPEWDIPIVVIGGASDSQVDHPNLIQLQGQLTITQTGYLLSKALAFIGNESGPAHWAGALGVPTITLFGGHSLAAEWAPLGKSLVLRTSVPCAPCHLRTCPVYDLACLKELTPEMVVPEIREFLKEHLRARPKIT